MYATAYKTQLEILRKKLDSKDSSKLYFLTLQADGSILNTQTKTVYKNWDDVEKELGTIIWDENETGTATMIFDDIVEQGEGDTFEDTGRKDA